MRITLVSFATGKFRIRQALFVLSARVCGVVSNHISWNPERLTKIGFYEDNPSILPSERGAGFWSWKPFVILKALETAAEGDWILYSDVGRLDVRLLRISVLSLTQWALESEQECVPGVHIPWHGTMEVWTKADAFNLLGCEEPRFRSAIPIQASFSLWKNTAASRSFVRTWYDSCRDRRLVSDDPNVCGVANSPNFKDHRHDQSVLSLLCMRNGIVGLDTGSQSSPSFEDRSLEPWLISLGGDPPTGFRSWLLGRLAGIYGTIEASVR